MSPGTFVCRDLIDILMEHLVEPRPHDLYYGHGARPGKSYSQGWSVFMLKPYPSDMLTLVISCNDAARY
jgi:hypothetical protein